VEVFSMSCEYCQLAAGEGHALILYENEQVLVVIKDTVATPGQITVIPKEHFTILEMVPDELLSVCAALANTVSMAVFDGLGAQGTNIVIQNGTSAGQARPHFAIEVIPRRENDKLNFEWKSLQLVGDELERLSEQLQEVAAPPKPEKKKVSTEEGKDNYLLKSLRKIP
jgi:histidine triad (HIT) family protein